MTRHELAIGIALALAAAPLAAEQAPSLCPVWPQPPSPADPDDTAIHLEGDVLDTDDAGASLLSGRVTLEYGARTLTADRMRYEPDGGTVAGAGTVRYSDPTLDISGGDALLDLDDERLRFEALEFRLHQRRARGSAASLEAVRDEPVVIEGVEYTTCPPDSSGWQLSAPRIELDTEAGIGTGRNVRVDFLGVPIFFTPWISFPLDDARKTGFLVPDVGNARNTGFDVRLPWYWNIGPQRDATLTPRWMADRGFQLATEYRYLGRHSAGQVDLEWLPHDRQRDDARGYAGWLHEAEPAQGWRYAVDFRHASDPDYFEDLAGSLDNTVVTHLGRHAGFSYRTDHQALVGRLDGWQTLDRTIPIAERPYSRLPQLLWSLAWPLGARGPAFTVDSELVYFHSDEAARDGGARLDLEPALALPLGGPAWHLDTRVAWRHTRYRLDGGGAPSRSVPSYSADAGLVFERSLPGQRVQTLEPRVQWLRVPYRDQSALPLFDTSRPDFNLVQLFERDRFNGADRVGDTEQLAFGLSSRVFAPDGAELLDLQLGRIRYFDERRVTLPGEISPQTARWSDYLADAGVRLSQDWSARAGLQYDADSAEIQRSAVLLRWHPSGDRLLNLGWHYRRGQYDQADVSFAWPLSARWSAVGRWNWSIADRRNLETFAGLEYQSCCWAVRVVSRRYIANRAGDTTHSLYLQLELKGLANVGRGTAALLERGILGYSSNR